MSDNVNHETNAQGIPVWVQEALDAKLAAADFGIMRRGFYEITVEREECGRFDCTVEVWVGRIEVEELDNWYGMEVDPAKQRCSPTWQDLDVFRL